MRLPLTITHTKERAGATRARIVPATTAMPFSCESSLSILATVDNILQSLPLSRLGDLSPIQILSGLRIVDDVSHRAGRDLALAACCCTGVHVR